MSIIIGTREFKRFDKSSGLVSVRAERTTWPLPAQDSSRTPTGPWSETLVVPLRVWLQTRWLRRRSRCNRRLFANWEVGNLWPHRIDPRDFGVAGGCPPLRLYISFAGCLEDS